MLGEILVSSGRSLDAVPHWQAFLKYVRDAKHVKTELRRSLVRGAIDELLRAHAGAQGQIDLFPPTDRADSYRAPSASDGSSAAPSDDEPSIVYLRSFDLSTEEGFDELCGMFIDTPDRRRRDWIDRPSTRGRRHHVPVPQGAAAEHHIGRNDPCTCGSGRKYKKCCGHSE
ncbi:MAG: SEC-C domain-containing protein [Planctomycetes bacterium]|nr:SEC-C domain-containing protein [Planctomycetota bacterium]